MEAFPIAFIVARSEMDLEMHSALPGAPMVPYEEPVSRVRQARAVLARGLTRAAQAVAPPKYNPAG